MRDRLWYARRGVPWVSVALPLALTLPVTLASRQWPETVGLLAPILLGLCAAAAAFLLDETALAVAAVTARGDRWRLGTRCALVALPVVVWTGVVALLRAPMPGASVDRAGWWLAGTAACVLAVGWASFVARVGAGTPGASIGATVVLLAVAPVVLGPFLDLPSPYPDASLSDVATALWVAIAALGLGLALASAYRVTPRIARG